MTDNTTCVHGQYHHFEQNGREYVQCIHCGEQANIVPGHTGHGLTPGQYIEQERKRLQSRNHGGELPPGLEYVTNTSGRDIPVYATKPGQVKATGWNTNKGRTWNPALGQYPPWYAIRGGKIRTCRVWKDKDRTIIGQVMKTFGLLPSWRWACRLCGLQSAGQTWKLAYQEANRHARNHH